MVRACRGDWCVLVREVVSTLMVQAGEVLLHATVSMGGGGVVSKDGCMGRSDVAGCCIDVRHGSWSDASCRHGACGIMWRIR